MASYAKIDVTLVIIVDIYAIGTGCGCKYYCLCVPGCVLKAVAAAADKMRGCLTCVPALFVPSLCRFPTVVLAQSFYTTCNTNPVVIFQSSPVVIFQTVSLPSTQSRVHLSSCQCDARRTTLGALRRSWLLTSTSSSPVRARCADALAPGSRPVPASD